MRSNLRDVVMHPFVDQHVLVGADTGQVVERRLVFEHVVGVADTGAPEGIAEADGVAQRAAVDSACIPSSVNRVSRSCGPRVSQNSANGSEATYTVKPEADLVRQLV